ncbi:5-oxoprolinase subunit PxpB [uncultured Shewanella sp.]|uniref:5-oxoprolinase subunit PxpB n=1 Tax=uncultured Shewanella sp. TaxID=173975 RepID=UPI00261B27F2|nr:5-oxoprolinase subunit PxpB [uncultured Shewanella sp.]
MITVHPITEDSLMINFDDTIHLSVTQTIMQLVEQLKLDSSSHLFSHQIKENILEITPSYTSLFIQYRASRLTYEDINAVLEIWIKTHSSSKKKLSTCLHELPVYYHPEVGLDLPLLAQQHQLTQKAIIQYHSQKEYHVYAIGFAPGFAFLGEVDSLIATPRRDSPRLNVPAGSVGIAEQQTAVYPNNTPGGWNIIGNCPSPLFDISASPITPFNVGDKVTFTPITREAFLALGGQIDKNWT